MLKVGRYIVLKVFLVLVVFVFPGSSANSAAQDFTTTSVMPIAHGAHIRPAIEYGQEIIAFNNLVQKDVAVVMYFLDWSGSQYSNVFDTYLANKIQQSLSNNGPVIMLSWQPINGKTPNCTKNYVGAIPLNDIIAGKCDTYIAKFAQALKARPERFLLRFAHEMNIADSPWWPGHFGQDASAYVLAYRHVYQVFTAQNVPNVEWVWSPNYQSSPVVSWNDRNNYYPGDAYVDWVGISGYNWNLYQQWMTFSDIYDSPASNYVLKDFACRYAKPQFIAEIGSVEGPGGSATKATWIADAYQKMPQFPFLRGVAWFNDYAYASVNGADFRVTSRDPVLPLPLGIGTWTNAYRQAVASASYAEVLPTLEQATPPMTYCGGNQPTFGLSSSSLTLRPGSSAEMIFTAIAYEQTTTLSLTFSSANLYGNIEPSIILPPWGSAKLTIAAVGSAPPGTYQVTIKGNGVPLVTITVTINSPVYLPLILTH